MVARSMTACLGGTEQAVDLGCGEKILAAFVGISCRIGATLYISPADRFLGHAAFLLGVSPYCQRYF